MKITDGIYYIEGINGNVYLVEDGDKLILIDTGLPRNDQKIIKYLEALGRKPTDISTIVFTHFHIDHVGNAKKIKELSGAKVAAHELDADYIAGTKAPPRPKSLMIKALSAVVKPNPVDVEIRLKDGDKIGRLLVIHTPGHSEGSIALLDAEQKVLFAGDTIRFIDGKIQGAPEGFTLDPVKAKESIGRIATFEFDIMLSGHGEPLRPEASKKIKEFYATLK